MEFIYKHYVTNPADGYGLQDILILDGTDHIPHLYINAGSYKEILTVEKVTIHSEHSLPEILIGD